MLSLMIVDDSNIIRKRINRSICNTCFKLVAQAANGQQAIHAYKEKPADVVTMDLTMPEMDGLACIKQLIKINPEVKILVVSALSDKDTGIEALELGALGFILKPFTETQLSDALLELIED